MSGEKELPNSASHGFPRRGPSGHVTDRAYTVEVRNDHFVPTVLGDTSRPGNHFVVDREWRTLPVDVVSGGFGVPNKLWAKHGPSHGLMSWACANALRWWAHAQLGLCTQTRIVEHQVQETWTITVIGYHDVVGGGGSEDRTRLAGGPVTKALTERVPLSREGDQ